MKKQNFARFEDITHKPLRIYNRAVMFHNLYEDSGRHVAEDYANTFTPEERIEIAKMSKLVRLKGAKVVQALVTAGMTFSDDLTFEVTHV